MDDEHDLIPVENSAERQQIKYIETMLIWCWAIVCDAEPTSNQHWLDVWRWQGRSSTHKIKVYAAVYTQQTRGIHPMLFQCWANVFDAGPTLKQHWVNASCLLGNGICRSRIHHAGEINRANSYHSQQTHNNILMRRNSEIDTVVYIELHMSTYYISNTKVRHDDE